MLFLHNTAASPRQEALPGDKYARLLSEKGFNSFPTLAWMDADGNVLMKQGERKVASFAETHAKAKRFAEVVAKGDKATPDERKEVFLSQLKEGLLVKAEDIQARAAKLTLGDADKAYVAGKLVDLEVAAITKKGRDAGPEKSADIIGQGFAALLAAGKTPSDDVRGFWEAVLGHAAKQKDKKLAERAFGELEKKHGKNERAAKQMEVWRKQLEEAGAK